VLRALQREPETHDALWSELALARGAHAACAALDLDAVDPAQARVLTERIALLLQAALLLQSAPSALAALFCTSRLAGARGLAFGTLPTGTELEPLLERALPG
jgi:putative acyl-CoA dehydrogenase